MPGILTSLYKMTHKEKLIKQISKQDHMLITNTLWKDTHLRKQSKNYTTNNYYCQPIFIVFPGNYNDTPSTPIFLLASLKPETGQLKGKSNNVFYLTAWITFVLFFFFGLPNKGRFTRIHNIRKSYVKDKEITEIFLKSF